MPFLRKVNRRSPAILADAAGLSLWFVVHRKTINYKPSTINRKSFGFTLIELLVVISIIGILTSIGTIAYTNAQQKSRDSRRKQDLADIKSALELARYDLGGYPSCDGQLGTGLCKPTDISTDPNLVPTYAEKVPGDPGGSGGIYSYIPDGCSGTPIKCTSYTLITCLENAKDPQGDNPKHPACPKASYTTKNPT